MSFVDESGAIANDRFFAVGLVKCHVPSRLMRGIQKLRDRKHWYTEFKFSELTLGKLGLYKELVDQCLSVGDLSFFGFISDRQVADPIARFGDAWTAYGKMAEQMVVASIDPDELMSVVADNYSTPDEVLFEERLKRDVNRRMGRLAVTTVCRLDSKASDGLQIADLFTSATAFEFRAAAGLASETSPKGRLAEYVRTSLGAKSFLSGWRNDLHSVQIYANGRPESYGADLASDKGANAAPA